EPVELCAIGRVEDCEVALEVAGIEEPGLELAEHAQQLVGEPAESRRAREAVERRRGDEPADEERPLRVRDETGAVEVDEEVVERPDPTGEERGPAPEKVPRDGVDVRSRRHDEHRVAVERLDVAVEEKLDFSRVRGPRDQAERHRSIVERHPDGSRGAATRFSAKSAKASLPVLSA